RALCSLSDLVAMAQPLLAPSGRLIAMKGPDGLREYQDEQARLHQEGWTLKSHRLTLPVSKAERCLIELQRS
ncbi:MAG: class I SAM-dependent methyltransferase, partial [Desulfuromonadales bacterium]|nr:class I SAM-dependent methyltransferase [Desulfuromonadales bacterium]